jgi:GTP cyclohydrolase IA
MGRSVDQVRIEAAVREILAAIGEDPQREGLRDTPERVARMYADILRGPTVEEPDHLGTVFAETHSELVLARDVPFYSMCEHHLMPFFGVAHIAYIPQGQITGLSKLVREFHRLAARPQVQERLTSQMADALMERLEPKGAAVVVEARHLCMEMRGVRTSGTLVTTSALRGLFKDRESTRMEFFTLIKGPRSMP